MVYRRLVSALPYAHRWWKYEHSIKSSVTASLLLGATVGVVRSHSIYGNEVREEPNDPLLPSENRQSWFYLARWSPMLSSGSFLFGEQRDSRPVETVISRLRELLATTISIAYAEAIPAALPAEGSEDSTSTGKDVYFTRHAIADAVAKAAPAVVNITVSLGGGRLSFAQTTGSGFIISSDGTILTNAHVVADEGMGSYKGKMMITMQDGRNFHGEIVSYDLLSDIAVIKVHSSKPLPTVEFGSSRKLRPGEWVVAVGSPLHLQNSVTVGIVSCVDRKSTEMGLQGVHADYIQTDAAINQGNSGGPLLNLDGQVIGINTMKALAADGVSFAIPIDSALKIVQQLKKHGRVIRPWLGMKMLGLTDEIIAQLKERDSRFPDVKTGVLVPQVIPGSPAERAGVRSGDVIVEFEGRPISTPYQIVEALEDKVGVPFKVKIQRARGHPITLSVITEEASPSF